jgi:TRAP-type mannitol/chloroaromatic compound transport system permease small subunit
LVFVLKTFIPLFALLMLLQGIAQAIRGWGALHEPR